MTATTSSKVKKATQLIEQLPESVTSTMLEDKLREIIDFLNQTKTK